MTDGDNHDWIISTDYSRPLRFVLTKSQKIWKPENETNKEDSLVEKTYWSLVEIVATTASESKRAGQNSAASIFTKYPRLASDLRSHEQWPGGSDPDNCTAQVRDTLNDAMHVRDRVGDNKKILGLHHVLFAVLLPRTPKRQRLPFRIIMDAGYKPVEFARHIRDYCLKADQASPSHRKWLRIADERLAVLEDFLKSERGSQTA